jgi:hypothetical protein
MATIAGEVVRFQTWSTVTVRLLLSNRLVAVFIIFAEFGPRIII